MKSRTTQEKSGLPRYFFKKGRPTTDHGHISVPEVLETSDINCPLSGSEPIILLIDDPTSLIAASIDVSYSARQPCEPVTSVHTEDSISVGAASLDTYPLPDSCVWDQSGTTSVVTPSAHRNPMLSFEMPALEAM